MKAKRFLALALCIAMVMGNASMVSAAQVEPMQTEDSIVEVESDAAGSQEQLTDEVNPTVAEESDEVEDTQVIIEPVDEEMVTDIEVETEELTEEVDSEDFEELSDESDAEIEVIDPTTGKTITGYLYVDSTSKKLAITTETSAEPSGMVCSLPFTSNESHLDIPGDCIGVDSDIFNADSENYQSYNAINVKSITFKTLSDSDSTVDIILGNNAFNGSAVESIIFDPCDGKKVTLGTKTFYNAQDLEKFKLNGRNLQFASASTDTFNGAKSLITFDANGSTISGNECPIPDRAFKGCQKLESVVFPYAEVIGEDSFSGCESLYTINLPKTKEIKPYAFSGCKTLKFNVLGCYDLEKIGDHAFEGCGFTGEISFIRYPRINYIGSSAFAKCEKLEKVDLYDLKYYGDPRTITVGSSVFMDCTSLKTVYINDYMETIPSQMFSGCTSLSQVGFHLDKSILKSVETLAFNNCTSLETIELPCQTESIDRFQKIATRAFDGCSKLSNVKIYSKFMSDENKWHSADISIASDAFPNKPLTIWGYNGNIKTFCEDNSAKKYTFKTLYENHTINITESSLGKLSVIGVTKELVKDTEDQYTYSAAKGTEVTILAEPNQGASLTAIILRRKDGSKINDIPIELVSTEKTNSKATFKFTMPDYEIIIEGEFTKDVGSSFVWEISDKDIAKFKVDSTKNELTITKAGQSTNLLIKAKGGSDYLGSWLFTYESQATDYVTIDGNGRIIARKKTQEGYPARIIAKLKSDNSKTVEFNVIVKEDAVVRKLDVASNALGVENAEAGYITRERITDKTFDYKGELIDDTKEYTIVTFDKSALANSSKEIYLNAVATEVDSAVNYYVDLDWASSNTDIAKVMTAKTTDNRAKILIAKGANGESGITVTYTYQEAADDESNVTVTKTVKTTVIIRVIDATPRIENANLTINKNSTCGTEIMLHPVYLFKIDSDGQRVATVEKIGTEDISFDKLKVVKKETTKQGVVSYPVYDGLRIEAVNGVGGNEDKVRYFMRTDSSLVVDEKKPINFNNALYIKGLFKNGKGEFIIPLGKISIVNTLPNTKLSFSGNINLFYKGDRFDSYGKPIGGDVTVTQNIKDIPIRSIALVSAEYVDKAGNPTKVDNDAFSKNFVIRGLDNSDGTKNYVTQWDSISDEILPKNEKTGLEYFTIERSSQNPIIKNPITEKPVTTGYICIWYEGFKKPVARKVTIPTTDVAPKIVLSSTSGVANGNMKTDQDFYVILLDKSKKKIDEMPVKIPDGSSLTYTDGTTDRSFRYDNAAVKVEPVISVNGSTYDKFNSKGDPELLVDTIRLRLHTKSGQIVNAGTAEINVQLEDWTREIRYKYIAKVNNSLASHKFTTKVGTINKRLPGSSADYQMVVNQKEAFYDTTSASMYSIRYVGNSKLADSATYLWHDLKVNTDTVNGYSAVNVKCILGSGSGSDYTKIAPGTYTFQYEQKYYYSYGGSAKHYEWTKPVKFNVVIMDKYPTVKLGTAKFNMNYTCGATESVSTNAVAVNIPFTGYKLGSDAVITAYTEKLKTQAQIDEARAIASSLQLNYVYGESGKPQYMVLRSDGSYSTSNKFSYNFIVSGVKAVYPNQRSVGTDAIYNFVTYNKTTATDVPYTFMITVSNITKAPTITQSAKGTINPIDKNTFIEYTAKVNNINSKVSDVKVLQYNDRLEEITDVTKQRFFYIDDDNNVTTSVSGTNVTRLYYRPGANAEKFESGKTYYVKMVYKLAATGPQEYETALLKVNLKQSGISIVSAPSSGWVYAGDNDKDKKEVEIWINKKIQNSWLDKDDKHLIYDSYYDAGVFDTVEVYSKMSALQRRAYSVRFMTLKDAYQRGYIKVAPSATEENNTYYKEVKNLKGIVVNYQSAIIVTVDNASLVPLNKAQKLTFEIKYKNQMDKSTVSTFNYNMTVKK